MFLLHINKNKLKKKDLIQIRYLKKIIEKIQIQKDFFTYLKKTKNYKTLRYKLTSDSLNFMSNNLVKYVIGISVYHTNTIMYVSDIKGKVKFFCTANSLGLKKKKKIVILAKLIKYTLSKTDFITKSDTVAVHFTNCTKRLTSFSLYFLKKLYNIEVIKVKNNQPFNGCRPKKIKRKKRQRLFFE